MVKVHYVNTFGPSQEHLMKQQDFPAACKCPCVNPNIDPTPTLPDFIENEYFCDTAFETDWITVPNYESIQVSDPLWDGEGCGPNSSCCHDRQRNVNPPWFVKTTVRISGRFFSTPDSLLF